MQRRAHQGETNNTTKTPKPAPFPSHKGDCLNNKNLVYALSLLMIEGFLDKHAPVSYATNGVVPWGLHDCKHCALFYFRSNKADYLLFHQLPAGPNQDQFLNTSVFSIQPTGHRTHPPSCSCYNPDRRKGSFLQAGTLLGICIAYTQTLTADSWH